MNLGTYLNRSKRYWPDTEALVAGDRRWTYRQLDDDANRLASALGGLGVEAGTSVATLASNRGELVVTEFALAKCGAVRVPLSVRLAPTEIAHVLSDAQVRVILVDPEQLATARDAISAAGADCQVVVFDPVPEARSGILAYEDLLSSGSTETVEVDVPVDHPAVLNFTSGSTGTLKAAVQTVGNRLANLRKMTMNPQGSMSAGSIYLVTGPITHASGMGVLACVFRGVKVVVLPKFSAEEFLATVERERVQLTFMVPVMLNRILSFPGREKYDISSLKGITLGGSAISPARLREAYEAFGPIVNQGYGQGETTSAVLFLTNDDVRRGVEEDPQILQSCGRAVYDTEVRVIDEDGQQLPPGEVGELVARGADCVTEYFRSPESTEQTFRNGWVHTGDLGYMREDGYFFIVDRKKDMIISGGFNVYCTEVESVLYEHPDVFEAIVIGAPDERWGETVKAFVALRPGASLTQEQLQEFCARSLAKYKVPRLVQFVDELPKNRNGKPDRRALREGEWAASDRKVG